MDFSPLNNPDKLSAMANLSYTPTVSGPEKKNSGCGCFGIGCGLLVLALIIGCGIGYWIFSSIRGLTSETAREIPVVQGSDEEWEALQKKLADYRADNKAGRAASLQLSDREINMLIDRHPAFARLKNRAFVQIADGSLLAQVSFPIDEVPGFNGRFLNGDAKFKIEITEGVFRLKAEELKAGKITFPAELLKFGENFVNQVMDEPSSREALNKFKSVKFEGNSIILESKAGQSAMPEAPAPPEQVEATPAPPTPPVSENPPPPPLPVAPQ